MVEAEDARAPAVEVAPARAACQAAIETEVRMSDPVEVLDFWLGEIGPEGWYSGARRGGRCLRGALWRSGDGRARGRAGALGGWPGRHAGLSDPDRPVSAQYPSRQALAFASDPLAPASRAQGAGGGLGSGRARTRAAVFLHAVRAFRGSWPIRIWPCELMEERMPSAPDMTLHARAHREMIARFGRFPGRNAALGRESTAAGGGVSG